jgi:hypothetical protein
VVADGALRVDDALAMNENFPGHASAKYSGASLGKNKLDRSHRLGSTLK